MKKLLVAIAAIAMLALGLVGLSGNPAQAADCPYSGCVDTTTIIKDSPSEIERGTSATFKVKVKPLAAQGTVTVTCDKRRGPAEVSGSDALNANNIAKVEVGPFKRVGKWDCVAHFARHGRFLGSSDSVTVHVGR